MIVILEDNLERVATMREAIADLPGAAAPVFFDRADAIADGGWTIMELGDGQVSGLPETCDPMDFYQAILRLDGGPTA